MATGVLCCSAATVLLLTSTSPFSSLSYFSCLFLVFQLFLCFFILLFLSSLTSVCLPLCIFVFSLPLLCPFCLPISVSLFLPVFPSFFFPLLFSAPTPFQVSECNWPSRQAPSLHNLFAVCKNMHNWLKQNPKNVCVITCSVRRRLHILIIFIPILHLISIDCLDSGRYKCCQVIIWIYRPLTNYPHLFTAIIVCCSVSPSLETNFHFDFCMKLSS